VKFEDWPDEWQEWRCSAPGVEGLRVDMMSYLRDLAPFDQLWERRTVIGILEGNEFHLLSVPDLVQAKKTQRAEDWPMIDALVSPQGWIFAQYGEGVCNPFLSRSTEKGSVRNIGKGIATPFFHEAPRRALVVKWV